MLVLERLSFGVGDRFAHQAGAQLDAFRRLAEDGVHVVPVWNKSNREHSFIGSEPPSVRAAAAAAVAAASWTRPWHVDADHIRFDTVERYLDCSDFFTIDVAEAIGQPAPGAEIDAFLARHPELVGELAIPGLAEPMRRTRAEAADAAGRYLAAAREAGRIHRRIAAAKGADGFIAEVSMDETDAPQTPPELLTILALLADEGVRAQTIAPKFTGRFNKGVDYVGDLAAFEREFRDDVATLAFAVRRYGLPANLKLSVHSGSDKFALYPIIRRTLAETGAGVHVKTAGTTWLEELIGLCEAGGDALALVREIHAQAAERIDELCGPYATVIDIDRARLPAPAETAAWSGPRFAAALRHVPGHADFNPHLRQLLHVAFKLAAKQGRRYTDLLERHAGIVGRQVRENLLERHLKPLFVG